MSIELILLSVNINLISFSNEAKLIKSSPLSVVSYPLGANTAILYLDINFSVILIYFNLIFD